MRKKLLSAVLCLSMVSLLFAGCTKNEGNTSTPTAAPTQEVQVTPTAAPATPTTKPEQQAPAAEALPEPVYYYSFDKADGTDGIRVVKKDTTATPIVQYVDDKDVVFVDGVKGQAIYADGVTGYKLPKVQGVGDTYTISFWVNASRFATYMPTVQYGPDIHGDLTGSQHYVNFTRTEWSGEPAFPCVWSYDQADNAKWPNWAPDAGEGEHVKDWVNIVFVVDGNNLSDDGELINAELYVNGVDYGIVPTVFNAMAPSENFEMLLGVNYWDATFKGAFDEFYVFDKALTAGQAATLFADGNQKATYVEPEHVFEFYKEEGAIESLGNAEFASAWMATKSSATEIKDGETWQIKLHNWSAGNKSTDNYGIIFANKDAGAEGYSEYAVVRADATGYTAAGDIAASAFTYSWGNWNTWTQKAMRDADVTVNITRQGSQLYVECDNVDFNEGSNRMTVTLDNLFTSASDPVVFYFTCENAYVDILSIKDKTVKIGNDTIIGATDCSQAFWTAFSDIWAVPEGTSVTKTFANFTDGVNNWDNFLVILQNVPTGHSAADNEAYAEYAVCRADAYGWGGAIGDYTTATIENNFNWDTFTSDMDGALCEVTVTNNGATADIVCNITTLDGTKYTEKYAGITTGGDLYMTFTCEKSYLVFGQETVVLGATDCSQAFWTTHSDIWEVPVGQTVVKSFTNYTDGVNNWDNYLVVLQNTPTGHSATDNEAYAEYAVCRADAYGWGGAIGDYTTAVLTNNINWDTFTGDMDAAHVEVAVTNNGATADVNCIITTVDHKTYYQSYKGITTGGDLYFCFTNEKSYQVFDYEDQTVVGPTDLTAAFWTFFSDIWAVPEGATVTKNFTNYTDGANNWDNFLVILQNVAEGHSADVDPNYAEYAVCRADAYGWGGTIGDYTTAVLENDFNWDTYTSDMDGADVTVSVVNNGATADVIITIVTKDGKVYHESYKGITIGGDLFMTFTLEKAYLIF